MGSQNTIWRIVVLALLCYSLLSFASVQSDLFRTRQLAAGLEEELGCLREENRSLQLQLSQGYDDEQIRLLARQRLGLVMPGEIVFYFDR